MMINLDLASGTRPSITSLWAYVATSLTFPGNPNARHSEGERARKEVLRLRKSLGMALGVSASHLVITSGGTEANALAILGAIRGLRARGILPEGAEVLMSEAEHASLSELRGQLQEWGVTLTTFPITDKGSVRIEDVLAVFTDRTVVVSIAALFGEVGTMPPVREIFMQLRAKERSTPLLLHSDASQACMHHDVSPQRLAADLVTIDAQKIYGPKGVGLLMGPGVSELTSLFGGTVLRPGTPPLPLIAAFEAAVRNIVLRRKERLHRLAGIRSQLVSSITDVFPEARFVSKREGTHILSVAFPGIDGEYLATYLSQRNILVATRSACSEGEESPAYSRIFGEHAKSVIRFSFSERNSKRDAQHLRYALTGFKTLVDRGVGRTYSESTTYAD